MKEKQKYMLREQIKNKTVMQVHFYDGYEDYKARVLREFPHNVAIVKRQMH